MANGEGTTVRAGHKRLVSAVGQHGGVTADGRSNPRSRVERDARHNARSIRRTLGEEIRNARLDSGLSLSKLALAAGIAKSHLHEIEAGEANAGMDALASVAAALGGRISVHYHPGTGPALRDHLQAAMLEAVLRSAHERWRRFLEVIVVRPVRGVIDLVLDDPDEGVTLAAEAHSELRRLEQQLRWSAAKSAALATGGSSELTVAVRQRRVSRLLLLRSTRTTRDLAIAHRELLGAAYPASHRDALAALMGQQRWPGAALIWLDVGRGSARVLDQPPRGVLLGRTGLADGPARP